MTPEPHSEHTHGPECGCAAERYITVDEPKHVCDPYCYHQSPKYKARTAKEEKRKLHERYFNPVLMRGRQPYPKDQVVPLRLLGTIPLIVAEDSPRPPPALIQEAQKEYKRARNRRRRRRP